MDLRLKIELNKGGHGIPLDKFAAISEQTVRLLNMFAVDLALPDPEHHWLAENFKNGSVDFDCRLLHHIEEPKLVRARAGLRMLLANDYSVPDISILIRPETRRQYARVADAIAPDEIIRFGVYANGEAEPNQWFELTRQLAETIDAPFDIKRESFGEIQGIVHAFFKETEKPYLKVRELSTKQLVNCYFPIAMYRHAVQVLEDPDAVVFVEGWVKEDPESGFVTAIDVTDFRPAPAFSIESFRAGLGSIPDYTGALTTIQALDKLRHD